MMLHININYTNIITYSYIQAAITSGVGPGPRMKTMRSDFKMSCLFLRPRPWQSKC